jgi:hypothetical protein
MGELSPRKMCISSLKIAMKAASLVVLADDDLSTLPVSRSHSEVGRYSIFRSVPGEQIMPMIG